MKRAKVALLIRDKNCQTGAQVCLEVPSGDSVATVWRRQCTTYAVAACHAVANLYVLKELHPP